MQGLHTVVIPTILTASFISLSATHFSLRPHRLPLKWVTLIPSLSSPTSSPTTISPFSSPIITTNHPRNQPPNPQIDRRSFSPPLNPPHRSTAKPLPQSKPDRRSDDAENGCDLESGARKKFNVSEDGEFEKPSIGGGGGRSHHRGGPRRSYRSGSRLICRPGREHIDQDAEDHLVTMSSKYRIFDRHSSSFRGNGVKRDGFGRGNWGTMEDEWLEEHQTCNVIEETDPGIVEDDLDVDQIDEDESEDKMTLEEYEKVMEEKKKALQATLLELSAKRNNDADIIKQESAKVTDDEEYMVDDFVMVEVTEAEAPSSEASKSKAWKFFG